MLIAAIVSWCHLSSLSICLSALRFYPVVTSPFRSLSMFPCCCHLQKDGANAGSKPRSATVQCALVSNTAVDKWSWNLCNLYLTLSVAASSLKTWFSCSRTLRIELANHPCMYMKYMYLCAKYIHQSTFKSWTNQASWTHNVVWFSWCGDDKLTLAMQ